MSTAFINYFGNGLLIISISAIIILFSVWGSIAQSSSGGNPIFGNSTNTTHLRGLNNVALWQQQALSANSSSTPENTMDPELMWSLIGIVVFAVFCVFIYCIVAICRACRCHSLILRRPPEHS